LIAMQKRRLILGLTSLFVALVAIEGLVRWRQWQRYGTTLPTYYRFVNDPVSGLRIPEPLSSVGPIAVRRSIQTKSALFGFVPLVKTVTTVSLRVALQPPLRSSSLRPRI